MSINPQQQQRRNDSFRPALRFPTDPHRPGVLPSKLQHIVSPPQPSAGPSASSSPGAIHHPPSAAANLLQSRRKPWELDLSKLDEAWRTADVLRKVILVLGDPPQASLEPIVTSGLLRGSLVLIVTSFENHLSISSQSCVPAVRILRLRPRVRAPAPTPQKTPSSRSTPSPPAPAADSTNEPLTALRLTTIIEWAERIANAWRADPPQAQARFAVLNEGEGPANGVGLPGVESKRLMKEGKDKRPPIPGFGSSNADPDGGGMGGWTKRFRGSNASLVSDGGSSTRSSIVFDVITNPTTAAAAHVAANSSSKTKKKPRPSISTSSFPSIHDVDAFDEGQYYQSPSSIGHAMSVGGHEQAGGGTDGRSNSRDGGPYMSTLAPASETPSIRKRTSFFGKMKSSSSKPGSSSSTTTTTATPTTSKTTPKLAVPQHSYTSSSSSTRNTQPTLQRPATAPPTPTRNSKSKVTGSNSSSKPSFDAIINFLPSSGATGASGSLHTNQGQIASQHAAAAHAKLLLRQTILVTTVTQRFLAPLPAKPALSPNRWSEDDFVNGGGGWGRWTHGEPSRMRGVTVGMRIVPVASQSTVEVGSSPSARRRQQQQASYNSKARRLSSTLTSLFSSSSASTTSTSGSGRGGVLLPPTPPLSRPSSEEDDYAMIQHKDARTSNNNSRRTSDDSSSTRLSSSSSTPPATPKLVHILPFTNAHASLPPPHLMNNTSVSAGAGTARLVRGLEAFLLSWSFGGVGRRRGAELGVSDGSGSGGSDVDEFGGQTASDGEVEKRRGVGMASSGSGGSLVKGNVRPFLLDLSGLSEVLATNTNSPSEEDSPPATRRPRNEQWSITEIILSGALDDEYSCSTRAGVPSPMLSRTNYPIDSGNGRPRTSPAALSPSSSGSSGMAALGFIGVAGGGTTPPASVGMGMSSSIPAEGDPDTAWASRRAWIGGVDDLAVYRMASSSSSNSKAKGDETGGGVIVKRARQQSFRTSPTPTPQLDVSMVSSFSTTANRSPQQQQHDGNFGLVIPNVRTSPAIVPQQPQASYQNQIQRVVPGGSHSRQPVAGGTSGMPPTSWAAPPAPAPIPPRKTPAPLPADVVNGRKSEERARPPIPTPSPVITPMVRAAAVSGPTRPSPPVVEMAQASSATPVTRKSLDERRPTTTVVRRLSEHHVRHNSETGGVKKTVLPPLPAPPPPPAMPSQPLPVARSMSADTRLSSPPPPPPPPQAYVARTQLQYPVQSKTLPTPPSSLRHPITPPSPDTPRKEYISNADLSQYQNLGKRSVSASQQQVPATAPGHARRVSEGVVVVPLDRTRSSPTSQSPLRNAVQHGSGPANNGLVKKLPAPPPPAALPTPPDSASSSSISNDAAADQSYPLQEKQKGKEKKWWAAGGSKILKML